MKAVQSEGQPLRILLACARPLVLKVEQWELHLKEAAAPYKAIVEKSLQSVADIGGVTVEGQVISFDLYPPRPDHKIIKEKLTSVIPLASINATQQAVPMDVHRPGEELESIAKALEDVTGVELYVLPAATHTDVRAFLQGQAVDVLHFAGHGDKGGGLYFEDGRGSARRVTPAELSRLVRGRVSFLFTGACHSANALSGLFPPGNKSAGAIPAAIAVDGEHPIPAHAVYLFSTAFYASIAQGIDLKTCFDNGLEAVREDDLIGERRLPDGADKGMPTPWKRFHLFGDTSLAWKVKNDDGKKIITLVKPSPHRKLPRTDELFVGRNIEIAGTVEALEPPRPGINEHKPRVVTLHGEGGIGKTRVAGAVAEWLAEWGKFPTGIVEVYCAPAASSVELAIAALSALGIERPESLPNPSAALVERLTPLEQPLLLLLDNLENLFPGNPVANQGEIVVPDNDHERNEINKLKPGILIKELLAASPSLRILATSRWPLNLGSDEIPLEVPPMRPEEAIQVFLESIPDRDVYNEILSRLKELEKLLSKILEATERMPLALVLMARQLQRHGETVETLLRQAATDLLSLLQDESLSYLPPRLRSVRASLQLSYDHLSEPARKLFARMSFLPGGIFHPLELLSNLLGESWRELLAREVAYFALARYDRDANRYTLLNPVREFAREKLDDSEGDEFRRQSVEFWTWMAHSYVPLLAPSQVPKEIQDALRLPEDPTKRLEALENWRQTAFGLLLSQEDNVIAAALWALGKGDEAGTNLLKAINPYLGLRALWRVQEALYGLAARWADAAGKQVEVLSLLGNRANALHRLHRQDEAKLAYSQILERFRALAKADPDAYLPDVAMTLNNLGLLLADLGERATARQHYEEALKEYRQLAERYPDAYLSYVAGTLNNLGALLADLGEKETARQHYQEALKLYRQLAQRYPDAYLPNVAMTLNNLGALLAGLGDPDKSGQHYQEALKLYRQLAQRYPDAYLPNVATTLNNLGNLLADLGERETARQHYEEALEIYRQLAQRYPDAYLSYVAGTLNNLGNLLAGLGEREMARQHYEEALGIYAPLFQKYPRAFGHNLLVVLTGLRRVYVALGDDVRAKEIEKLIEKLTQGNGKPGD